MTVALDINDLIPLFNRLFLQSENTLLVAGGDEPIYQPADEHHPHHRLIFAHGFYESALHEISHWCIAGPERRKQVDFGYWYEPDGRSAQQQRAFEQVEIKPQAVEWILSEACGRRFYVSTDNLNGDPAAVEAGLARFRQAVREQACLYLTHGLPPRAEVLKKALLDYYQRQSLFGVHLFAPE
ncbi:elongation factor P hydroxylase [Thalassolituus pacificus]|uniref:Elongation factor P hydroxylase n=1 Tax=Thalassolituus pacificus TaxID=2975440 RepID=A0A9X2WGX2_9GAMM|nr:elongation factor P hydroxylase [Thalassolituus pacificus]MCT7359845.1 elongation factor P hydroxylase [Thalassolituus pacificus]